MVNRHSGIYPAGIQAHPSELERRNTWHPVNIRTLETGISQQNDDPAQHHDEEAQPLHSIEMTQVDAASISMHLQSIQQFLDSHVKNLTTLQSSLRNYSLQNSDIDSTIESQDEDSKWEKLSNEHKMWTKLFSAIAVISNLLVVLAITSLSLTHDVIQQLSETKALHTAAVSGHVAFFCGFMATSLSFSSLAKSAVGSYGAYRKQLPWAQLRLLACGIILLFGVATLFSAVSLTTTQFMYPTATPHLSSSIPTLIIFGIVEIGILVDLGGGFMGDIARLIRSRWDTPS
ncbi:hypothetical protein H2248_007935 [Termitomyces sp. 'cryptogamus']|nr:hypothetical protein H2248_007935 [Termitomyces sp. 'cryptogamus']